MQHTELQTGDKVKITDGDWLGYTGVLGEPAQDGTWKVGTYNDAGEPVLITCLADWLESIEKPNSETLQTRLIEWIKQKENMAWVAIGLIVILMMGVAIMQEKEPVKPQGPTLSVERQEIIDEIVSLEKEISLELDTQKKYRDNTRTSVERVKNLRQRVSELQEKQISISQ